jgi:hypothetical protein
VRQLAWLHAVPKPPEGSGRAKANQVNKLSRFDQMKRDRITPAMPPNPVPHILARLIEIGITQPGGMGPVPLSWSEIANWQRDTGVRLEPWEARLMRQLSISYLGELALAESENRPAPWRTEVTAREREVEEARLRAVLG